MNNENFQEMLSDGRILEIALQYVLQAGITKKKGREHRKYDRLFTGAIGGYGHGGAYRDPAEQAGDHAEFKGAYVSEKSH